MNVLKVLSPYRFPEVLQVFGICVSMFFFVTQYPDTGICLWWTFAMLTSIASAFWLNDFFDFNDDLVNDRKEKHASKLSALMPAVSAFIISLLSAVQVSPGVIISVFLVAGASVLYSSPLLRLKSKIFFPFLIHFFMGFIFFQSASSITDFVWTTETKMMGLFWALILGTGSLGNELVDQTVDENSKIKTVANTYPSLIRKFIFTALSLALFILLAEMHYLGMIISQTLTVAMGILYFFWYLTKSKSLPPGIFRRVYRIIFIVMIVAFHAEKYFRS